MIMPVEAYTTLQESGGNSFAGVHKFVVGAEGEVVTHT